MREIKFRGKRIDNGEWIVGFYGELDNGHTKRSYIMTSSLSFSPNAHAYFADYEVYPETVGQYTGLNDINNVEIYEGSMLLISDRDMPQHVYLDQEGCYGTDEFALFELNRSEGRTFEVIGNIHDNPELLKEQLR